MVRTLDPVQLADFILVCFGAKSPEAHPCDRLVVAAVHGLLGSAGTGGSQELGIPHGPALNLQGMQT